ncbi:hypothetical protein CC78DRAFT_607950 [Lojkania enalia]|uniref:Uncharacterized protein n=1 Tax=Lojkania enalia TaxID=147567 RepID=A0A9P4N3Q1_9PLEO|nr:hypothetical protein CC78DRAFT_607950 [Didymosphaeria enalia]
MFELIRHAISPAHEKEESPQSYGRGINILVGRRGDEEEIFVTSRVLRACPVLKRSLIEGYWVVNVNPAIFRILIEHLNNERGIDRLLHGPHLMLSFAKAWYLAKAFGLPNFQNRLTDLFQEKYCQLLRDRVIIQPDQEPISFLQSNVGFHTQAEKFIIEFYAGLCRWYGDISPKLEGLAPDTARHIAERWRLIVSSEGRNDRIMDYRCFRVPSTVLDNPKILQICPPPTPPLSRPATVPVQASTPPPKLPVQPTGLPRSNSNLSFSKRVRMLVPGLSSANGGDEVIVEPGSLTTAIKALQERSSTPSPVPARRHSLTPYYSSPLSRPPSTSVRAPFMPQSPSRLLVRSRMIAHEDESSEDDEPSDYFTEVFQKKMYIVEKEFEIGKDKEGR